MPQSFQKYLKIWLHHLKLGHPTFQLLKTMFHLLLKKKTQFIVYVAICEFVKNHNVSFPLS